MLSNTQLLWWQGVVLPRAAEDAIAPDNNIIRGISDADSRGGFMKLTYYHWFCGGPPPVDRTRLFWMRNGGLEPLLGLGLACWT